MDGYLICQGCLVILARVYQRSKSQMVPSDFIGCQRENKCFLQPQSISSEGSAVEISVLKGSGNLIIQHLSKSYREE
jgi:hypothetical protein